MREVQRTGDSVLSVDINKIPNSKEAMVTFYRQIRKDVEDGELIQLTSFILDYEGATNLVIELQKHLIFNH